jgi:predicted permease
MLESIRRFARRVRGLLGYRARERDMDDEMRFHLEMEAAELRRSGVPRQEAARQARLTFGAVEAVKEDARDARGTRLIENVWQDLRYAARQLRSSPGYATVTVLTLALGVGATTMIHSYGRVLSSEGKTLANPDRLVYVGQGPPTCRLCPNLAAGNYLTIRQHARSLESVSMISEWEPIVRGPDRTELTDGQRVTPEFFRTLGIGPMLGRTLVPDDSALDRQHVIVLTERMWRSQFNADRSVLGQTLVLDRVPYSIVGVVADDAVYPRDTEFWAPLILTPDDATDRKSADYRVVGRLRQGATLAMAAAEVGGIAAQLASEDPASMKRTTFKAAPLLDLHRFRREGSTNASAIAVGLVLLIACINLAGLLIARLSVRRRELAIRRAMGAVAGRLVRQLLAETLLLTTLGGAVGAVFSLWGARLLLGGGELFELDFQVFSVAVAVGLMSGVLIGLWPAIRFAQPSLLPELRGSRAATASADTTRARRILVIGQVALAIVLLSAAGLLARSFSEMYGVRPGFDTDHLLTVRVRLPQPMPNAHSEHAGVDRLVQAIDAMPGVERAGATLGIPFGHGEISGRFEIEGRPSESAEEGPQARMHAATAGYFEALGIQLLRGRTFSENDGANARRVAIINEEMARTYFADQDPIGRVVMIDSVRWQIVGVIAAIFQGNFEQMRLPEIYRPMQQWERPTMWIAIRTRGEPAQMRESVVAAVRRFDPDIAVTRLFTMQSLRANDMGSERGALRMMTTFALAAILIATIGLYGLISYSVAQRAREFGMRVALGARRAAVLRLVLGEGLRLAAIGAAVGVVGSLAALRVMRSMLYAVSPTDPLTLGTAVLAICAVALLAAFVPAQRAMLVDPMATLRND